jgi:hypothetical protein
MNNRFQDFVNVLIQQLGDEITHIVYQEINAIILESKQIDQEINRRLNNDNVMLLKVYVTYTLGSGNPITRLLYVDSQEELTPKLALKIKKMICPHFNEHVLIAGWGPGRTEEEIGNHSRVYYVKGELVEIPSGPITI